MNDYKEQFSETAWKTDAILPCKGRKTGTLRVTFSLVILSFFFLFIFIFKWF